jgi:cytochrome P450
MDKQRSTKHTYKIKDRVTPNPLKIGGELRCSGAWIPFGVGPRNCVGMRFALTELKMAAVAVVQNFTVVRCDETEVYSMFGLYKFSLNSDEL